MSKILSSTKARFYLRTTQHFSKEIRLKKGEVRESEHIVKTMVIIMIHSRSRKELYVMCDNYIRCYTYGIHMYKINVMLS